jgi:hypothetical protein
MIDERQFRKQWLSGLDGAVGSKARGSRLASKFGGKAAPAAPPKAEIEIEPAAEPGAEVPPVICQHCGMPATGEVPAEDDPMAAEGVEGELPEVSDEDLALLSAGPDEEA